jgi:DNA-binding MarR family transcriptional regulator
MGLGVKQFVVLAILDKQNTPGALRSALGAPASTITNIINELEKKQLIKREIHPEDRRQYVLRRTDLGAEFLKKGMGAVEEVLAVRAAGMSEEDLAAFQRVESILFGWAIKSS